LERSGVISKDEEFWEFVKEYYFVSLEETWMDGKSWEKLREWLPNSHEWKMMEARKERKKGKAKGGRDVGEEMGMGKCGGERLVEGRGRIDASRHS